jgi:hypothetical protein
VPSMHNCSSFIHSHMHPCDSKVQSLSFTCNLVNNFVSWYPVAWGS